MGVFSLDKPLTHEKSRYWNSKHSSAQLSFYIFDHSKQNEQKDKTEETAKSAKKNWYQHII